MHYGWMLYGPTTAWKIWDPGEAKIKTHSGVTFDGQNTLEAEESPEAHTPEEQNMLEAEESPEAHTPDERNTPEAEESLEAHTPEEQKMIEASETADSAAVPVGPSPDPGPAYIDGLAPSLRTLSVSHPRTW